MGLTEVQECIRDMSYYLVEKFPVYKLLESDFLSAFMRKGHLNARTVGSWCEVDQSVVVASGKLQLSVGKDTYQELGLSGQPEVILSKHGTAKYCKFIMCSLFSIPMKLIGRQVFCYSRCDN